MLYCKIENGQIQAPAHLPVTYANISGFNLMDEDIVNSYGFYRYAISNKPSYDPNSHKLIESLVLNDDIVASVYSVVPMNESEFLTSLQNMKMGFVSIVDQFLDDAVQIKDYKNILHACSYSESTIPQYKNEALAIIAWRDTVWQQAYQIQNDILAGQRTIPTEQEFIAELPQMEWPE